MQVLLVEDDVSMVSMVKMALTRESINVDIVSRGGETLPQLKTRNYDVMVLDLMLPDMDGYQVIKDVRQAGYHLPVLILSGLSHTDNKIQGLNFGADDYLTKPFDRRELIARIHTLSRRGAQGVSAPVVETGFLRLELEPKRVFVAGQMAELTAKEYAILEMLARNHGVAIGKQEIMEELYDPKAKKYPSERIIAVFICKLRKKLSDLDPEQTNYIRTAWGRGYTLPELPVMSAA